MTNTGKLIYVIGPSGAGKDTILQKAREKVAGTLPLILAHRYITRYPEAGGENHVFLTKPEFLLRKKLDLFALDWASHEHHYGIGKEIDHWLQAGARVLMNGSRGYLPEASRKYPEMKVILIDVSEETLWHRLRSRGRESEADIRKRIERSASFKKISHSDLSIINNDGPVDRAVEELLEVLRF